MKIRKLDDNTLLVPKRVEEDGMVGDAILEIKPGHIDYQKYVEQYNREKLLEKNEMEGGKFR